MTRWPFRCRGCDNDPHGFRLGPWRWWVSLNGYRGTGRRMRRVVGLSYFRGDWLPGYVELWPRPLGQRHPMWRSSPTHHQGEEK